MGPMRDPLEQAAFDAAFEILAGPASGDQKERAQAAAEEFLASYDAALAVLAAARALASR